MLLVFPVAATVKSLINNLGIYLHIPFCSKKCRYCDFYSAFPTRTLLDDYTNTLIKSIKQWGGSINRPIDTLYFGGGTPSLLNDRLIKIVNAVKESFEVEKDAEITLELNPSGEIEEILYNAKNAGINRLSIGMQSGINSELELLGRQHTFEDTVYTVNKARQMGFSNISLDLMIGLPYSDKSTLKESLEKITNLCPEHISAYILKIEKNTAFYKMAESFTMPDDDQTADQYLFMCDYLENRGYRHYEISNFAKENMESRHNLKYWRVEDYLGIGPAAHSAMDGKRFYYPRDLKGFTNGTEPLPDGDEGSKQETVMLRLRLKEGISKRDYVNLFGMDEFEIFDSKCRLFEKNGLMKINDENYSLTNEGMLISNAIITEILEDLT